MAKTSKESLTSPNELGAIERSYYVIVKEQRKKLPDGNEDNVEDRYEMGMTHYFVHGVYSSSEAITEVESLFCTNGVGRQMTVKESVAVKAFNRGDGFVEVFEMQ